MNDDKTIAVLAVVLVILITGIYVAHTFVQRNVYKRQGVEMSFTEVFLGAKPVERYVKGEK